MKRVNWLSLKRSFASQKKKPMKKKTLLIALCWLLVLTGSGLPMQAQEAPERVEPPFWWTEMEHTELQIMVHADQIGATRVEIDHPGVNIREVVAVESPNYLFIYLDITDAMPGTMPLRFIREGEAVFTYDYELREREPDARYREGVNASDAMYLLMPDRFANGDPSLDDQPGMLEQADRSDPDGRHGGDIPGIVNNLDYIAGMGFTAMWLNPVLENDQPRYSYHGYATTDYYKIDPRYGSNEDYRNMVKEAEAMGIKTVKDIILNHCGHHHWWMDDLPSPDWLNQWDEFTRTTYRMTTIVDPHGSRYDYERMVDGWFDTNMPDLNQRNRLLARYLKQNSVWWIEYAGIHAIRMDTQPYADRFFMSDWAQYVLNEYPYFNIIGEAWSGVPAISSYYQGGVDNHDGYDSNFPSLFDFSLYDAIGQAFNEEQGWGSGMMRLYNSLAQDFLYSDPYNLVVFGSNHDTDRFFTRVDEDIDKLEMALTFIYTTRGIPQVYTGTELLKSAWEHDGHGEMRTDFPGGWPDDPVNKFTREGRTPDQNRIVDHITALGEFRKDNPVLHYGWLLHFVPEDNVYVYFRYDEVDTIMVILNNNDSEYQLDLERFEEGWGGYSGAEEVFSGRERNGFDSWNIPANSASVYQLW